MSVFMDMLNAEKVLAETEKVAMQGSVAAGLAPGGLPHAALFKPGNIEAGILELARLEKLYTITNIIYDSQTGRVSFIVAAG